MRDVEFEVSDSAHPVRAAAHGARHQRARAQSPVPWLVLSGVLLILAGAAVAQQAEHGLLSEEGEVHYLYSDGVRTASWRWDSRAQPDHDTVAWIGNALAPATDVPEWQCLFTADAPQSHGVPYSGPGEVPEGSIVCSGSTCREAEMHTSVDGSVPCSTTRQWIPPVGWVRPPDLDQETG